MSIQIHDQFATHLLVAVQRGKLKMELNVSQAATTEDEIYQELLKGHAAEAVSEPGAATTSPRAAIGGLEGGGLAAGAEEQQAPELQQAVESPSRGPGMDTIQQVRCHSGPLLSAWGIMPPVLHPAVADHAHFCAESAAAGPGSC